MKTLNFTWHKIAGNREIGRTEDGHFSVTRLEDWQYVIRFRTPPQPGQSQTERPAREWTWVVDSTGRKLEFDALDEALDQAQKEREKSLVQFS